MVGIACEMHQKKKKKLSSFLTRYQKGLASNYSPFVRAKSAHQEDSTLHA